MALVTKEESETLGFEDNDIARYLMMEEPNLNLNSQGELEFPTDEETIDIDVKCQQQMHDFVNQDVILAEANDFKIIDAHLLTNRKDIESILPPKYGPPERNDFHGDLKFELQVSSTDVHKKKYMYSTALHRIYADMNVNFSIHFAWEGHRGGPPLYVRATTVFSDQDQAQKRVERCLQHKHSVQGNDPERVHHVLRSASELGTEGVFYCGYAEKPDSWYSVLIQAPSGVSHVCPFSHAFQFACKNSCSSGINRRAIQIIFTLESYNGTVLGRQTVGARACACPKRDMIKDEENERLHNGKRRITDPASKASEPATKKVKVKISEAVDDDEAVFTLPPLQIVGAKTLTTGLSVCLNMMEQCSNYKKNDPKAQEKFTKAISGLKTYIEKVKKSQTPPQ